MSPPNPKTCHALLKTDPSRTCTNAVSHKFCGQHGDPSSRAGEGTCQRRDCSWWEKKVEKEKVKEQDQDQDQLNINNATVAELQKRGATASQAQKLFDSINCCDKKCGKLLYWEDVERITSEACAERLYRYKVRLRDKADIAPKEVKEIKNLAKSKPVKEYPLLDGPMTTNQYRKELEKRGIPIEHGQHIFHIIAKANGGADRTRNYTLAGGGRLNIQLGHRHDPFLCFLVGKEKAKKAVDVSKRHGKYRRPSAEELYRLGEDVWREIRYIDRNGSV